MVINNKERTYCLVASCLDQTGIVAAVSQFVADRQGSFYESNYHNDSQSRGFFMRNVISAKSLSISIEKFREQFVPLAEKFKMKWHIRDSHKPQKDVLLANLASHCLSDILYRWHSGELTCEAPCVVSNHESLRSAVEWYDIPFHCVPVSKENKPQAFAQMTEIVTKCLADTLLLARFMQIIPPELCASYTGRLINIHHRFLPSFIGENP